MCNRKLGVFLSIQHFMSFDCKVMAQDIKEEVRE